MGLTAARRRMLTFGLIPVAALVLGGGAVTVSMIHGKRGFDYAQAFAPLAGGVSIASDMPVAVTASVDEEVHVRVDGSYTDTRPVAGTTTTGDRLEVGISCHGSSGCRVRLAVEVPAGLPLSVRTTQTSMVVLGMSGPLQIDATDGTVDAADLSSPTVSVESHSGSVQLFFSKPPTTVDATTSNGSLRVEVPVPAAYAISAAADQGSSDISVPNDLSAPRRLNLSSSNGSITVNGTQQR
jgi:hypothetical protein